MNTKIGYYPILDIALALRQLYSVERFKPFNSIMSSIDGRLTEKERSTINEIGDDSRGWLHVIEKLIPLTLNGITGFEEFALFLTENPDLLWDNEKSNSIKESSAIEILGLWFNYFNSEIAKNNKTIFEKSMEISHDLKKYELINYISEMTDRAEKIDENSMRILIKPEHIIDFTKVKNVIVTPSIFASRKFSFWNIDENYIFYISTEKYGLKDLEPTDMMMLKTLALNDRTRLKMLRLLAKGNYSTSDIAEKFDMNSSTISRHLKLFKDAGYVDIFTQEGNSVYYELNLEEIRKSFEMLTKYIKGEK